MWILKRRAGEAGSLVVAVREAPEVPVGRAAAGTAYAAAVVRVLRGQVVRRVIRVPQVLADNPESERLECTWTILTRLPLEVGPTAPGA